MKILKKMEFRNIATTFNALEINDDLILEGYVNKTGELSHELGYDTRFKERILKGAFKRALDNANINNNNIFLLHEHDIHGLPMASTKNGSLELFEDEIGLFFRAKLNKNVSFIKDVYELVKDNHYAMSFGFNVINQSWEKVEGQLIRNISELDLFEISLVKNPAYGQSVVNARSLDFNDIDIPNIDDNEFRNEEQDIEISNLKEQINNLEAELKKSVEQNNAYKSIIDTYKSILN